MPAVDEQTATTYAADLGEHATPAERALRAELVELVETLHGERLTSARDYLRYLLGVEDEAEASAELRPRVQAALDQAQADVDAGRTRAWQDVKRDV